MQHYVQPKRELGLHFRQAWKEAFISNSLLYFIIFKLVSCFSDLLLYLLLYLTCLCWCLLLIRSYEAVLLLKR